MSTKLRIKKSIGNSKEKYIDTHSNVFWFSLYHYRKGFPEVHNILDLIILIEDWSVLKMFLQPLVR